MLSRAAEGMTDKQIAQELGISLSTVDTYWRRIRQRYAAGSRTEAVAKALNLRWSDEVTFYQAETERLTLEVGQQHHVEEELRERVEDQRVVEGRQVEEIKLLFEYIWRTRVLMAASGTVMWWADLRAPWTIEWISDSVSQWGYQAAELKDQMPILDLVYEEDAVAFEAGILLAGRNPLRPVEREYRIRTKDSGIRLVRERLVSGVNPLYGEPKLVGVQMDIQSSKSK